MVAFADRVAVPSHVLVRVLDGESVFLNLETERYFGLDETGTRMWQLLTSLPSIDAVYQQFRGPPSASCNQRPASCHSE